ADLLRQLEPLVEPVDHHDAARAHLARYCARVDAKPARALDHYRLPGPELGDLEPRVDLRVGAVDPGRHLVGDLGGELEHRVVRPQVEVLAEAALEVRPDLARHEPVGLADRAGLVLAAQAGRAAPARAEVAVQHAAADLSRLPHRVGGDA